MGQENKGSSKSKLPDLGAHNRRLYSSKASTTPKTTSNAQRIRARKGVVTNQRNDFVFPCPIP